MHVRGFSAWNEGDDHVGEWVGEVSKVLELLGALPVKCQQLVRRDSRHPTANRAVVLAIMRLPEQLVLAHHPWLDFRELGEPRL